MLRTAALGATAELLRADATGVLERWEKIRRLALDIQPPADLSSRVPANAIPSRACCAITAPRSKR